MTMEAYAAMSSSASAKLTHLCTRYRLTPTTSSRAVSYPAQRVHTARSHLGGLQQHCRRSCRRTCSRRTATGVQVQNAVAPRGVTFDLPVDYSQLLGLRGREAYLEAQISAACEELAGSELEEGYSVRVQAGRRALLQEARSWLLQHQGQPPPAAARSITVDWDNMAGALSLLQEVGEYDVVIEVGSRLLDKWESRQFRRDILLAMALAYCGLATEAFAGKDEVAVGCGRMEEALSLLQQAGNPAPQLADDIQQALQDLHPASLLNQLQLPLGLEHAAVREAAVAGVKALLEGGPTAAAVDAAYVRQALERMTALEVAFLLDWEHLARDPAAAPWGYPGLVETGALAHLVAGFTQRKPNLITVADSIFRRIPKDGNNLAARVALRMLLGCPNAAISLLKDEGRRSTSRREGAGGGEERYHLAEVLAFVRSNSGAEGDDLLPGLVLFTEQWLSKVAFQLFRDTAAVLPSASLVEYYEDRGVTSYLSLHGEEASPALQRTAAALRAMLAPLRTLLRGRPTLKTQEFLRFAAVVGLTVGGAAVLTAVKPRPAQAPSPTAATADAAADAAAPRWGLPWHSSSAATSQQPLDAATAEQTVRTWQEAKAAALGPRRNKAPLRQVLAEPLLSTILEQATTAEKRGWFWNYKLNALKIEKIEAAGAEGGETAAVVVARLEEQAELWGENGKQADSYRSSYRAEYRLLQRPNGSWRIADALVLG